MKNCIMPNLSENYRYSLVNKVKKLVGLFNLSIDCDNYKQTKMILICYVLYEYMKIMVIYIILLLNEI